VRVRPGVPSISIRRTPVYRAMRDWALRVSFVRRDFASRKWGVEDSYVALLEEELRRHGVVSRASPRNEWRGRARGAFHIDRDAAARYAAILSSGRTRLAQLASQMKGGRHWHEYYWTHRPARLETQRRWGHTNAGARALLARMKRKWKEGGQSGECPRISDARAAMAAGTEPYVDLSRVRSFATLQAGTTQFASEAVA
jgi:hypothetical protein